jgi:hypothetical protein
VALAIDGNALAFRLRYDRITAPSCARPAHLDLPSIADRQIS